VLAYTVRRLLQGLFVLLAVIWFTFTLSYLQPQGADAPAYVLCSTHLTPQCLAYNIHLLGLNHSYFSRLWGYIWGLFAHLNLGYSYKNNEPVSSELAVFIPRTFWIAFVSLILAAVIAIPLGIIQAWKRNSVFDYAATGVSFVLYAVPAFVLGTVLLDIFVYHLHWFPASPTDVAANGSVGPFMIFTDPSAFVLPVVTLTALSIAGMSRFMRSQVLDVLVQDYIRTAKAKGCDTKGILLRHTMRNAMGPIVVILGLSIPILLSGALIVENLFIYPGLGFETVSASLNGDIYTVLAITVLVTIATIAGNFAADIGLGLLNPRIRIEGGTQ
jgi:peptide/nickel transport system permease protein